MSIHSGTPESSTSAGSSQPKRPTEETDDRLTICAISLVAAIVTDLLHEGVGHGLTALATGARSGVLTTVAWSSGFDSRLVEAGGTLVNLLAALLFWLVLGASRRASVAVRYFLLITFAFNLFSGTGYFLFSGVTDFGDWAAVIAGLHPHWLWRTALVVVGAASYYASARAIGVGLVRFAGVPRERQRRLRSLTIVPYVSGIVLSSAAALLNPSGIQLLWQSALPAAAGGQSGLLWLRYVIPSSAASQESQALLRRNYPWVIGGAILALAFVLLLGRGITIRR
jgi:hypothetical protein